MIGTTIARREAEKSEILKVRSAFIYAPVKRRALQGRGVIQAQEHSA